MIMSLIQLDIQNIKIDLITFRQYSSYFHMARNVIVINL
jgi:hypothetical protein